MVTGPTEAYPTLLLWSLRL